MTKDQRREIYNKARGEMILKTLPFDLASAFDAGVKAGKEMAGATQPLTRCQSNSDGECDHHDCPQIKDGEPQATGRSCPLYPWVVNDIEEEPRY